MHDEQRKTGKSGRGAKKPTRDAHGRWVPGYCPNPRGRPTKSKGPTKDETEIWTFGQTKIQIRTGGEIKTMERREALLHRIFEDAMKGKTSAQKFLYEQFEQREMDIAEFRQRYEELVNDWIINNPKFKTLGINSIPLQVRIEIAALESLLNYLFPESYTKYLGPWFAFGDKDK